jgi:hypothetical protein
MEKDGFTWGKRLEIKKPVDKSVDIVEKWTFFVQLLSIYPHFVDSFSTCPQLLIQKRGELSPPFFLILFLLLWDVP